MPATRHINHQVSNYASQGDVTLRTLICRGSHVSTHCILITSLSSSNSPLQVRVDPFPPGYGPLTLPATMWDNKYIWVGNAQSPELLPNHHGYGRPCKRAGDLCKGCMPTRLGRQYIANICERFDYSYACKIMVVVVPKQEELTCFYCNWC